MMGSYSVGGLTVEIVEGDITQADTDAITNAANSELWMGAGVAGAIKRKGGDVVEREAVDKGPITVGSAVATTAGDLPHTYVIHGAVMGADRKASAELISLTTESCLECAEQLDISSVALPAFGTGVGGFGLEECARLMVAAIDEFAAQPRDLERVAVVLFGAEAHAAFEGVAEARWGS